MPTIRIIAVGKAKGEWTSGAFAHYEKLLRKYATLEIIELPDAKLGASAEISAIKKIEGEALLRRATGDTIMALDRSGKALSSEEFAALLTSRLTKADSVIDLLIGGAYGLDKNVLAKSQAILSLSTLTLSHLIARAVLLEQIYRGFSIIHRTPYHK